MNIKKKILVHIVAQKQLISNIFDYSSNLVLSNLVFGRISNIFNIKTIGTYIKHFIYIKGTMHVLESCDVKTAWHTFDLHNELS